jgi:hypothetical protein
MASANAWFDLRSFDQSPIKRNDEKSIQFKRSNSPAESIKNGLLYNIAPHLTASDIFKLIDECLSLKSLSLHTGLDDSEAFYLVNESEYVQFVSGLELFGDSLKHKELNQTLDYYKVNNIPAERQNAFFKRMKQVSGAEGYANNAYLICCDYQRLLIENYLATQGSEFIKGFDSILVKADFVDNPTHPSVIKFCFPHFFLIDRDKYYYIYLVFKLSSQQWFKCLKLQNRNVKIKFLYRNFKLEKITSQIYF